ncbi:DUF202 domain-containing protein [Actinokineospora iranica]|nr:DUF202 domain-containing protein [Actinokineospora iranica]
MDTDAPDAEGGPPGLQAERTRLAWTRTALSAAAVGALLAHGAESALGFACAGVVLGCAVGFVRCGTARYRRGAGPLSWWVGVLAVLPGVAALVAVLAR